MTKGNAHKPSGEREGFWFRHNRDKIPPINSTITQDMQIEPFSEEGKAYPPRPTYIDTFVKNNAFSSHDNRHGHQDHGVYFGNGRDTRYQGKRMVPLDVRIHNSETAYLKHNCRVPVNYNYTTENGHNYLGRATDSPPKHVRYPRAHQYHPTGLTPLSTTTVSQFQPSDVPYVTPTSLLVSARESQNRWKYSYNAPTPIYPPYDIHTTQMGTVLNKYGAAFNIAIPLAK